MNSGLRTAMIVVGGITLAALLMLAGVWIGRAAPAGPAAAYPGYGAVMMGANEMPYGGMMGSGSRMAGGMMGFQGNATDAEPLSPETASQAVEKFLDDAGIPGLEVGEIMIFENHAYAEIIESETGIGAMEVLVDPATLAVYPEYGPNMMWNLKFGAMSENGGRMMGMMGGAMHFSTPAEDLGADMPVTLEKARESAQAYLDSALPGTQVDDHADRFYGYYTLHVLRDGEVIGMLSVNGYTRQVFLHTWHGEFIEMGGE